MTDKIEKSPADWQQQLTPEQYRVCREKGTERAFTGEYNDCHDAGIYRCVCCSNALFDAATKYDSGSGWPSYFQPIRADAVAEHSDATLGMRRVEVTCKRCGAHLGHVFEDGPEPTGLRYCINSVALKLETK